jgi:hypothetical protein
MPGSKDDAPYDPREGPDLRYELKAADIVRELIEPDSWWRRRGSSAGTPTYRVVGKYITGVLNLRGAVLDMLLHFERCLFEHRPDVRESQLLGLSFSDCVLPGLRGRNLRCRNDLRLHRCVVRMTPAEHAAEPGTSLTMNPKTAEPGVPDAAVVLTDAVVEGSVVLTGSTVRHSHGKAIQADRLRVAGAVTAYRMVTSGEVRLSGMTSGGDVIFSGSQLRNPRGIALNATGVHVRGSLLCERDPGKAARNEQPREFTAEGMLFVPGATIDGDFWLSGARITGQTPGDFSGIGIEQWRDGAYAGDPSIDPWPSLVGDRLRVEGNLVADRLAAYGTVRMVNALVGGSFRLSDATVVAERREQEPHYDRAIHLDGSEISGDLQAARLQARGQLRLADIKVGGNVLARNAELRHPRRMVFLARRAVVAGNVEIVNARVRGTVQLQGAQVGGSVRFSGTAFTDPAVHGHRNFSVGMRAATVGRDLVMARFADEVMRADGGVNLDAVRVGRILTLDGALLGSLRTVVALDAGGATADEFQLTPGKPPQGRVILRGAHCGSLEDNEALWQATGKVEVDDFRYDALAEPIDLDDNVQVLRRVWWLRNAMNGYRPGPYDQLAAVLRAAGNEEHAVTVLMLKQRYRYEALASGRARPVAAGITLWSTVQRVLVGYGYKPMRALGWLVLLLVLGSLWFWLTPDSCVHDPRFTVSGPRCLVNADDTGLEWNPVLYTADLLLPIVDLGNKGRWHMSGVDKWVATGFIAAGWILATTVAAGITRTLHRS